MASEMSLSRWQGKSEGWNADVATRVEKRGGGGGAFPGDSLHCVLCLASAETVTLACALCIDCSNTVAKSIHLLCFLGK